LDELPTPLNPQFVYMLTNILAKNHSDKPSSVHVLDWLAKKGVDFNTVADDNGSSFLLGAWYHACQHRSILLVNKLLELGVNPLKQNASGRSTFAFVIGAAFGLDPISLDVSCSMLQKLDADQIQKARKEVSVLLKRKAGGMRNIQLAASLFTGTLLDEKDTTIGTKACQSCKNRSEGIQKCGTCKAILYCSHSCQKNDWRLHKQICPRLKAIRTLFIEDN
jgi:hypothetical protein